MFGQSTLDMHVLETFNSYKLLPLRVIACADLEGGSGGSGPPLEFATLNIADITGNEKLLIFHICELV